MNQKLLLLPLATVAAATTTVGAAPKSKAPRPNYIVVFVDDMGYGDISALDPKSKISTPNLDRMANSGVVFTDAHTTSSVSTPSRYGMLTGRYNWRSTLKRGVVSGYSKPIIPASRQTMASMLKKAGYTTAAIGKWHLGWNWHFDVAPTNLNSHVSKGKGVINYEKPITGGPTDLGFDYYYGHCGSLDMPPYVYVENNMPTAVPNRDTEQNKKQYPYGWWRKGPTSPDFVHVEVTPNLVNRACKYVTEQAKKDDPFFLYLPLPAPHTPILPTKEYQGKSGIGDYGDFVMMVDALVGDLLNTVDEVGIADNTIIVFTSDNGCSPAAGIPAMEKKGHFANSIYRGNKADLYDGGHRVPFIVQWKGGTKPHAVDQPVSTADLYATFASLAGTQLSDNEGEDSYDISPLLTSTKEPKELIREAVVHHSVEGQFAIRKGDWKLLLSPSSGGWSYPRPGKDKEVIATLPNVQLYNMKDDVSEKTNVQDKYPEVVKELRDLLVKYVEQGRSTPGKPQKNDGKYPWAQLGWMNK